MYLSFIFPFSLRSFSRSRPVFRKKAEIFQKIRGSIFPRNDYNENKGVLRETGHPRSRTQIVRKGRVLRMELIRISDRKLKIMLTPSDMSQFEMNAERLGEDSEQMRRSFRLLMREVRRKIAFDLDDRRVSVQYFPSREGGCEMFVSSSPQEEGKKRALQSVAPVPLPIRSAKTAQVFHRETACRFRDMETLLRVCARLQAIRFAGESTAYRDRGSGYWLLLRVGAPSPFLAPREFSFLSEYGEIRNAAYLRLYIREYADLICDRAVEQLSALV